MPTLDQNRHAHIPGMPTDSTGAASSQIRSVASAIVFNEAMEKNAMIGSAVAITGVLLYSLAEQAGKGKAKAH